MQAKEIMSKEVITVRRSTTLKELLKRFDKFHMFPLVPVVENDRRLVGVVSFRNLIDIFLPYNPAMLKTIPFLDEEREDIFQSELAEEMGTLIVVEDIMERKFMSIDEDTPLEKAYDTMKLHLQDQFPVVDKMGNLQGIIGIFDILREAFKQKGIV
jgi:CBS domain-containing protein